MRWMLVIVVSMLLSSTTLSQDSVLRRRELEDGKIPVRQLLEKILTFVEERDILNRSGHYKKAEMTVLIDRSLCNFAEQLESIAIKRIPSCASEAQRTKLRLAAKIDARRTIAEIGENYGHGNRGLPDRIKRWERKADVEIFGSESLFVKVMRQQGFLRECATDF